MTKGIRQTLIDAGINSFGADLLAESFLKSPLAAQVRERGTEPLRFFLDVRRKDCPDFDGVSIAMWPVKPGEGMGMDNLPALGTDREVTDGMALAFHHALTDGDIGAEELEEIKTGLRAAFAVMRGQA